MINFSNINDRILYLIEKQYNNNQKKFAESIGFAAQVIFNIVSGRKSKPSYDVLEAIISTNDNINSEWLLTGKGEMLKADTQSSFKSYPKPDRKNRQLPLIPVEAIAGFGVGEFTIIEHDVLEYYKIPEFSNADFLIPVKGSSMQPKYYGGDILACKHIQSFSFFQWGVPHVLTIKDRGTVVKRIKEGKNKGELILISDNERYEPFTITLDDLVNIAIVVGVIRVEN